MKVIDIKHLSQVGETYWQHLSWCLYSTLVFVVMIPLAILHGLFPFLFANVPDKIMISYLQNFKNRRIKTGQEERYKTE
jgi:hypothetical protein